MVMTDVFAGIRVILESRPTKKDVQCDNGVVISGGGGRMKSFHFKQRSKLKTNFAPYKCLTLTSLYSSVFNTVIITLITTMILTFPQLIKSQKDIQSLKGVMVT